MVNTKLLYDVYRKSRVLRCCMQWQRFESLFIIHTETCSLALIHAATTSTKLLYNICKRIAISPFMHVATASHELFYDIHRKWRSRRWCMQQQWAGSFFIIYTENCSLVIAVHILMVNTELFYNILKIAVSPLWLDKPQAVTPIINIYIEVGVNVVGYTR